MTGTSRITSSVFASTSAAILVAAVALTQAVAAGAPAGLRMLARPVCHGLPARCFHLGGVPMPICARCTGLYIGMLAGIALFVSWKKLQWLVLPTWLVLGMIAPMVIDGVTQGLGLRESFNELRLFTGVLAGTASLAWVMNRIEIGGRSAAVVSSRESEFRRLELT